MRSTCLLTPSLVAALACSPGKDGSGTDADTTAESTATTGDAGTTDTPTGDDTGAAFTPTPGAYALERGERGGTCNLGNLISGSVSFSAANIAVVDAGFTIELLDGLDDPRLLTCTFAGDDFSCTGPSEPLFTQTDPDATASLVYSAHGTWTGAATLEFVLVGALACTGDAAACDQAGTDWELVMPCEMSQAHLGALAE